MEVEKVNTESQSLALQLKAFPAIQNADSYVKAAEVLTEGRAMMKSIDAAYDSLIAAAYNAHRGAVAKKASYYKPIEEGVKFIKGLMERFDAEQEEKRLAEERRLQEEARKQEEERRLQDALEAEASGNKEEAEDLMNAPVDAPVVTVQKQTPKIAGVSFREIWDAEVTDFPALVKAVASGQVSINALEANQKFLRLQAQSLKATMRIPGVKACSRRV